MYAKNYFKIPLFAALLATLFFTLVSPSIAQTGAPNAKDGPVIHSPSKDLDAIVEELLATEGPRAVEEFIAHGSNSFNRDSQSVPLSGAGTKGGGRAYNWEKIGPSGGDFFGVASNPSNADEVILLGGRSGATYRTYDGGQNWTEGPSFPLKDIGLFYDWTVFDAFGPNERLYGTDLYSPASSTDNSAIWYSADGGYTWSVFVLPDDYKCYNVCPHPTDPNIVFGSGEEDITESAVFYKSTDGGQTWTSTALAFPSELFGGVGLDVCKANPDVICMTIERDSDDYPYVLKSTDGGSNWSAITPASMVQGESVWPIGIDPTDENRIYVLSENYLYMTADGGATWTTAPGVGSSDFVGCIGVDPNNPATVYCGEDDGVWVTSDYGQNWTFHAHGARKWNLDVNASAPTAYILNWNVAVINTDDGGQTWNPCNNGIFASRVRCQKVVPSTPETIYANTNEGLQVSYDSGNNWQPLPNPEPFENSYDMLVNSNNPDIILAAARPTGIYDEEIFMSLDAGSSWFSVLQGDYIEELVEHPHNSNIVYAVGYIFAYPDYTVMFYESTDAGFTWSETVISGPGPDRAYGRDLVVSQTDPSILYLCGCEGGVGKIWVSNDGGQNWFDGTGDLGTFLDPNSFVSDCRQIWMSPTDPERLVVSCYGVYGPESNFVSTNAGTTWTPIPAMSDDLFHHADDFAYHPGLDTVYMAAYKGGVWKSDDQGLTWESMNDGYPGDRCYCVDIDLRNGNLFAGTYTESIARLEVPAAPLWVGADEVSSATGGSVDLLLNAPERIGHWYVLAGTVSGTQPGFDIGYTHVPLNFDWFTSFCIENLNAPWFARFFDQLDGDGKATAQLTLPKAPGWAGTVMHFAFVTIYPEDFASNPVEVVITE